MKRLTEKKTMNLIFIHIVSKRDAAGDPNRVQDA